MSKDLVSRLRDIDRVSGSLFIDAKVPEDPTSTRLPVAFMMEGEVDASKPLADQLVCWLAVCAAQIDIARIGISQLHGLNIDKVHRHHRVRRAVKP